ncbi:hypothetical protein CRUP_021923, partial [Coryphaenoides rupestris]
LYASLPVPEGRLVAGTPSAKTFTRLCGRDPEDRAAALDELTQAVLTRLDPDQDQDQDLDLDLDLDRDRLDPDCQGPGSERLCRATLLRLLRLSRSCPLPEVRERAAKLLRTAQERGVEVPRALTSGSSAFIPAKEMATEGTEQEVLLEAFFSLGRLDNITMAMALHPAYLSCFLRTQHALLDLDGPLPSLWRHYIVIMAASRHQCSYLVQQHTAAYLEAGGDESWLAGLQHVPAKLRGLQALNKLLAHRPWLVTQQHIEELVCPGAESRWSLAELIHAVILMAHAHSLSSFVWGCGELVCPGAESRWSLAELIHAVILMAHAHSLSSFVWGCGVNPEPDHTGGHAFSPPSPNHLPRSPHSPAHEDGRHELTDGVMEVEVLMKRMAELQEQEEECTQEEMLTRFERERSESIPTAVVRGAPPEVVLRLVEDPGYSYEDFAPRGEQAPPTMRAQDYSWEDHGYSLVNRLLPDMGQLLDEKFQVVSNLTYHRMAMHEGVDTYTLRKALWNYIHCLYGIRYDDYDYGGVNVLLERSLKVHANLIVMEARLQAALLYTLRAITHYMR